MRWRREQRRQKYIALGRDAAEFGAPVEPTKARPTVARPDDLSPSTAAVWDALAPHATEAGTLTPASAWGFRDLCETIVLQRAMLARISRDGLMVEGAAHDLITKHTALKARVETGMQRFRLLPMGKELLVRAEHVDEFAEFDAPLTVIQGGKA